MSAACTRGARCSCSRRRRPTRRCMGDALAVLHPVLARQVAHTSVTAPHGRCQKVTLRRFLFFWTRSVARTFAREGANVFLAGRRLESIGMVAKEIAAD